jgi:hypothetical protein
MTRYKVIYFVGKSKREAIIEADDLDHAEKRADEKGFKWEDIIACNKTMQQDSDFDYKRHDVADGGMPNNEIGSCL